MKTEDSRRFPQRRNGVSHPVYGNGVVETVLTGSNMPTRQLWNTVLVDFDGAGKIWVGPQELTSQPSRGVSPDPKTSRYSGWVGGNSYRSRK